MIRLYKEGDDIPTPLQVGDIIEVQSGVFVKIKEILTENEEELAGIKESDDQYDETRAQRGLEEHEEYLLDFHHQAKCAVLSP